MCMVHFAWCMVHGPPACSAACTLPAPWWPRGLPQRPSCPGQTCRRPPGAAAPRPPAGIAGSGSPGATRRSQGACMHARRCTLVCLQAHPPVGGEHREGQVVNDMVGVLGAVGELLHAGREAGQAQVEVDAHGALHAHAVADVVVAVVAVEERPGGQPFQAPGASARAHAAAQDRPGAPLAGLLEQADGCACLALVPAPGLGTCSRAQPLQGPPAGDSWRQSSHLEAPFSGAIAVLTPWRGQQRVHPRARAAAAPRSCWLICRGCSVLVAHRAWTRKPCSSAADRPSQRRSPPLCSCSAC